MYVYTVYILQRLLLVWSGTLFLLLLLLLLMLKGVYVIEKTECANVDSLKKHIALKQLSQSR